MVSSRCAKSRLSPVSSSLVYASIELIERHSLNATDALILRSALEVAGAIRDGGDEILLISCDSRLLRAAQAEGLAVFNPELDTPENMDSLRRYLAVCHENALTALEEMTAEAQRMGLYD